MPELALPGTDEEERGGGEGNEKRVREGKRRRQGKRVRQGKRETDSYHWGFLLLNSIQLV